MDNYVIFAVSDTFTNQLRDLLTSYVKETLNTLLPAKCVRLKPTEAPTFRQPSLRICLLMQTTQKEQACWTTVSNDNIAGGVERVLAQAGIGQEESSRDLSFQEHIAGCISQLSSTLPKQGAHTELYWISNTVFYPAIDDSLDLFGALKELYDEYHTDVCLVTTRDPCSDAEPWTHMLRGCTLPPDQLTSHITGLQWHGSISIQEAQFSTPLLLPGFTLHRRTSSHSHMRLVTDVPSDEHLRSSSKETRPECRMHFVSQVDLATIPSFYLTSHSYTLKIHSSSKHLSQSRALLETLQENPNVGYIVRLYMESAGSDNIDHTLSTSGRSSQLGWRDDKEEINHKIELLHFLLISDNDDSTSSCLAHLMTSLTALNPDAGRHLVESDIRVKTEDADALKQAEEFLSTLPYYTGSQFKVMVETIEEMQREVLQEWMAHKEAKGLSLELHVGELISLLSAVRREVTTGLHDVFPRSQPPIDSTKKTQPFIANNDYDVNLYTGLERAALVARAEQQRSFERNQSDESIGGLAPPMQGQVLKLDVTEFLKHFKSDGTAASEDLQTVQLKRADMLLCQYTHENLQDWGEGHQEKQHDTYFNVGQQADRIEKKCDKLKARLQSVETFSTCSYVQAGSPAAMTMAVPRKLKDKPQKGEKTRTPTKVRKSPRKHPRGHGLRTSPRKHARSDNMGQTRGALQEKPSRNVRNGDKPERRDNVEGSKRLLASHKVSAAAKENQSKAAAEASDRQARISRSQRHKKKLEEVVKVSLESKGVTNEDPIFKPCAQRLYTLVKCFVKDLATSHNLRQEMTRLAELHVGQVIDFEKTRASKPM